MPKAKMFAPHDSKLNVWMNPMFFEHAGQAERTWVDLCNQPDTLMSKHPSDFVLYQVGEFDYDTGQVRPLEVPVQLMSAVAAKKKPDAELPMGAIR